MTPGITPYAAQGVYELITSFEWMSRRRGESWHDGHYLDDLVELQRACESGKMEDLPRRINLSYLEHLIRQPYSPRYGEELPAKVLCPLVLLMPYDLDEVIQLASLAGDHEHRIDALADLASCLWLLDHIGESRDALNRAIDLYKTAVATDYKDLYSRRNQGFRLCEVTARFGEIDDDVIDIARAEHKSILIYSENDEAGTLWLKLEPAIAILA